MAGGETCIHLDECPYRSLETLPPMAQFTRQTMAIILAGGRGERLGHLTDWRAKPAVPFGGKFRIIDFTLSNCVNSGIRRIGICTQYKAQSLIRHGWSRWKCSGSIFTTCLDPRWCMLFAPPPPPRNR